MRHKSVSPILTACVLGFLSFSGCLDITTTSQVNRDGSIVRTITFTGDSAEVYRGKFPVDIDSTWSRSFARVSGKERHYTLTASKSFRDVAEMNRALRGVFSKTLQYQFELDKSFQWFFTVYQYRETNLPFEQFTSIPMTEFLSKEEIKWATEKILDKEHPEREFTTRGDSLAAESMIPRIEEYGLRNMFEPVFAAFLEGVKMTNNPSLTTGMVESLKDSLYKRSKEPLNHGKIDTLCTIFTRVLRTPLVEKAWTAGTKGLEEFERKLNFEHETNSHKYVTSVVMPGLITGSNATNIEGTTATWRDFKDHAHYFGYTMWVESRQVNWWAVIVAAVVVVSLVAALIVSTLRRRNRTI